MTEQASMEQRSVKQREPFFTLAPVVLLFIAACVGIHLIRAWLLSADFDFVVLVHTAFIPLRYSGEYAFDLPALLSPMSYSLLHGDGVHLVINMIWLAAFGSPLAHRIGTLRFIGFWLFTAVGSAAVHFLVHPFDASPLIGASGAISGMMAAAARFGFAVDRNLMRPAFAGPRLSLGEMVRRRNTIVFLIVWFVVNLIAGFGWLVANESGEIAWEAHIGGFLAGWVGIVLFDRPQRASR